MPVSYHHCEGCDSNYRTVTERDLCSEEHNSLLEPEFVPSVRIWTCPTCHYNYATRLEYAGHRLWYHRISEPEVRKELHMSAFIANCPVCLKQFTNPGQFCEHLSAHHRFNSGQIDALLATLPPFIDEAPPMTVTIPDPTTLPPQPNDTQSSATPVPSSQSTESDQSTEPDDTTPEARITELENEVTALKKALVETSQLARDANAQIAQLLPFLNQLGNHRHDSNGTIVVPLAALHGNSQSRQG